MKRAYEAPRAEKVDFDYKDVVIASSSAKPGHYGTNSWRACYHGKGAGEVQCEVKE